MRGFRVSEPQPNVPCGSECDVGAASAGAARFGVRSQQLPLSRAGGDAMAVGSKGGVRSPQLPLSRAGGGTMAVGSKGGKRWLLRPHSKALRAGFSHRTTSCARVAHLHMAGATVRRYRFPEPFVSDEQGYPHCGRSTFPDVNSIYGGGFDGEITSLRNPNASHKESGKLRGLAWPRHGRRGRNCGGATR